MTSLTTRDRALIWHPFTQELTAPERIAITRASGSYVYDEAGHAYLDLISSWWVNLHGHGHPAIAERLYHQAQHLEHILFAGFTHPPAVELCERLHTLLPSSLSRFFFSDNGSTAVEVALKMAYQYWHNQGQQHKTLFLSLEGGYHGDTFGAMAVGRRSGFHDCFQELFFHVLTIPYPETWDHDTTIAAKETAALQVLDDHLLKHGEKIAALILEPLIQGASGMRLCRASFLETVIQRVREHNILVIFDEVMTGFGRTGPYFALEQINLTPDFLCLSKGITGGFLPLALTVTTEQVYTAFLSSKWQHAFAHGHSYTANPIACAAALASLELLQNPLCDAARHDIHQAHCHGLQQLFSAYPILQHPRILGTISAFEVPETQLLTPTIRQKFLHAGLLIRPLGQTIYLLPPYSTTPAELADAYIKIRDILITV